MWDKVRRAARKAEDIIHKRIDSLFPQDPASLLELRHQILENVEDNIEFDRGGASFPYDEIRISFLQADEDQRDVLNRAFVEERPIRNDIVALLHTHQCRIASEPVVVVQFMSEDQMAGTSPFRIDFSRRPREAGRTLAARHEPQPAAMLTVLKGAADPIVLNVRKKRTRIGRVKELFDLEGAIARRNDLTFADNDDEVNATVGRAHATIVFDGGTRDFRVVDETSRFGTRIFRDDRTINVLPGGRGITLRDGDEIYFGRACVRFETPGGDKAQN
ncbi:MAG: FHA domain-containing protein [Acidobacteria bacterium]|nr:MAG: FHA domain-containing protein [Acidobacteriota bacterium]